MIRELIFSGIDVTAFSRISARDLTISASTAAGEEKAMIDVANRLKENREAMFQ